MDGNTSSRIRKRLADICFALTFGLVVASHAQNPGDRKKATPGPTSGANSSLARYEDDYMNIQIPTTWKIANRKLEFGPDEVQLIRNGFTLTLDNDAIHSGPTLGGRFIDAFGIPWLEGQDVTYPWTCGGFFLQRAQPANQQLTFYNLIFPSLGSSAREMCGIPADLPIEGRWFGGYFSTGEGLWVFGAQSPECPDKAYTLTGPAKTPDKLPLADDPSLRKVIQEAIGIVTSIHHKRCPPLRVEPR